jgi:hypothetical protein
MADSLASLQGLCGLRTAPELSAEQARGLRVELDRQIAACEWFTIGVMAPSAAEAVSALRAAEVALGWRPLELDPAGAAPEAIAGPVFLKGNQNTGRFLVRSEAGLGQGILLTGHNAVDPTAENTWGPLPLHFF